MKYRVSTYVTFTGTTDFVDLGDMCYGEWIIYNGDIPKFHIAIFRENSKSDTLIKNLIEKEKLNIEFIIQRLNKSMNLDLRFGKRPWVEIIKSSELKELDLVPIPVSWIEKIINTNGS